MTLRYLRHIAYGAAVGLALIGSAAPVAGQAPEPLLCDVRDAGTEDCLCDVAFQDCRTPLLDLIRNETVSIDVAFWFMEDARYTTALAERWRAGVPIRVLVDTRANSSNPLNADRLAELEVAGIPMRRRTAGGILHWKTMIFGGQNVVEFSASNYSPEGFRPEIPYQNYVDEAIYFTDDPEMVNSFKTKYDDLWTNTTAYADYRNIIGPLGRLHDPPEPKDPELNFPPLESFTSRSLSAYRAETQKIDVTMYRITERRHTDAMIDAFVNRGIPVRLITEPEQYRSPIRQWHSWNVDRLYMAGIPIRIRAHAGYMHQKSTILYGQRKTIFGSSNWTSPSSSAQEEHNYFTTKSLFFDWFVNQFERKWNNSAGYEETAPFVPEPPDTPVYVSPAYQATGVGDAATLTWRPGLFAHIYDIYFGTTPTPPLLAAGLELGPGANENATLQYTVTGLSSGTTYYWRVVSKTMAERMASGPVWEFTTGGPPTPPPVNGVPGPGDVVLYAGSATVAGAWRVVPDSNAANGSRVHQPNLGASKITTASASPADYFELTFNAEAGRGYRLWMRGRADQNNYSNDSVHVQFSDSVTAAGEPVYRIGSTSSTVVAIEDCSGCGLSGWGWADNGYGNFGPLIYFASSGPQTIKVQPREDGISIDQILLSPEKFLTLAPGATKDDTTVYPSEGAPPPPPPPPPPPGEIVLWAMRTATLAGAWGIELEPGAAGGAKVRQPNAGAPKITAPSANPTDYFELTFNAEAGRGYRLWIRGRADDNHYNNDSAYVQFSGSVDVNGAPVNRIGSTSAEIYILEAFSGAGVLGWGWEDNGYAGDGALVYFDTTGPQTIRIQTREDGLAIDQIVLSPVTFLSLSPGLTKGDTRILPESGGGS